MHLLPYMLLGKQLMEVVFDTCAIESGAYTSAALRGIFGGKVYKRDVEYHITNSLAILMLRFKLRNLFKSFRRANLYAVH